MTCLAAGCYGSNHPPAKGGYNLERVSYEAPTKPDTLVTDLATLNVKELEEKPRPLVFSSELRVDHPLLFKGSIVPMDRRIEKSMVRVEFFMTMTDSKRLITQTCQTLAEKTSNGELKFEMATGGPKTKGRQFVELTFVDFRDGNTLPVVIALGEVTIE
ncbi:MAG: hypothetical protein H7062_02325 [Candidatus Saccharimonas sp.]|nr:hypothetical protein [Planctomycetaceae bacterium]